MVPEERLRRQAVAGAVVSLFAYTLVALVPPLLAKLAVDQGIKDAATFIEGEASALVEWNYGVEQAAMIDSPVLSWGAASENPINPAARAFLYELFPQREAVILEDGDHFSVTTDPAAVAEPIAEFVSRHSAAAALT